MTTFNPADVRRSLRTDGFTLLKGVVTGGLLEELRQQVLDPSVGKVIETKDRLEKRVERDSLTEPLRRMDEAIVPSMSAILNGELGASLGFVQLINQFKQEGIVTPSSRRGGFHVDGHGYLARDGGTWDKLPGFKIAAGLFLSDLSKPDRGNLQVCRGAHLLVEQFFRGQGAEWFRDGKFSGDALQKMKELYAWLNPQIEFDPVFAEPGDLVVFHCLMPHRVGSNHYADRPAIYTRYGQFVPTGLSALQNSCEGWLE